MSYNCSHIKYYHTLIKRLLLFSIKILEFPLIPFSHTTDKVNFKKKKFISFPYDKGKD